jgi:hypothetical protein
MHGEHNVKQRNSVSFMEPEVSLSYSEKSDAGICREPHESNQHNSNVEGIF